MNSGTPPLASTATRCTIGSMLALMHPRKPSSTEVGDVPVEGVLEVAVLTITVEVVLPDLGMAVEVVAAADFSDKRLHGKSVC